MRRGARTIADIGGGAHPVVAEDFLARKNLDYTVIDISDVDIGQGTEGLSQGLHRHRRVDGALRESDRKAEVRPNLLAHGDGAPLGTRHCAAQRVQCAQARRCSLHLFATANTLPLFLNRLLPDWLTSVGVRIPARTRRLGINGSFQPITGCA